MATATAVPPGKVRLLIDYTGTLSKVLIERRESGKVILRGELGRADVVTSNNRLYPRAILDREIKRLKKEAKARKLFGELDHPCLIDPNFRVLTLDGWKSFGDIKVGDKVWSRKDGKAVVSIVNAVVNQPYDGPAYRFKGRSIDSGFTPAHRHLLTYRPNEVCEEELYATSFEIASKRFAYSHSAIPKCAAWDRSGTEYVTIPGITVGTKTQHLRHNVVSDLRLDAKLFAAFMGLYLSEGCCLSENSEDYVIFISQKTPWARKFIWDEVLSRFPDELVWHEEKHGFYLSDARLYTYLKKLGNEYEKYIPLDVKNLDPDCLNELIFWFCVGDGRMMESIPSNAQEDNWNVLDGGWKDTGESFGSSVATAVRSRTLPYVRRDVFSVSERLILDLHECVVRAGGCGSIQRIEPDADYEFLGRVIKAESKVPLYQLHISTSKNIWLDPRFLKVEEVQHKGNIYCLSVTHGNFYVEQKGHAFWTGNSDGRTQYQRVSHIIRDIEMTDDGRVMGEVEIILTSRGKDLAAIAESGGAIGFSSRGTGTTHKREDGVDVVNEDYSLITFDAVADPAHAGAYPDVFFESKEAKNLGRVVMPDKKALEEQERIEAEIQRRVDEALAKAKEKFQSDLLDQISELRRQVEEEVRDETLNDPKYQDAKARLESLRRTLGTTEGVAKEDYEKVLNTLREREAEIEALKKQVQEKDEQTQKFAGMAKKNAVERYIEKMAATVSNPTLFKKLVGGKITENDTAEDIKKKVEEVIAIVNDVDATNKIKSQKIKEVSDEILKVVKETEDRLTSEIAALKKENEQLAAKNEKYRDLVEKSLMAAREGYVEAIKREVVEAKTAGLPFRHKIIKLVESANLRTKAEIEQFVEAAIRAEGRDSKILTDVRSKISRESTVLTEEGVEKPSILRREQEATLYGYPVSYLQKLAGVKPGSK